ncbi:MAG: hypothetical protein PHY05_03580 [Methanothrix sp.]|nr:hypothetical protein [Methanothrix sp.]
MQKIFPLKRWLCMALVAASFTFYGCLLLVPFSSLSAERKIALSAVLVILGERSFDWRRRLFCMEGKN